MRTFSYESKNAKFPISVSMNLLDQMIELESNEHIVAAAIQLGKARKPRRSLRRKNHSFQGHCL